MKTAREIGFNWAAPRRARRARPTSPTTRSPSRFNWAAPRRARRAGRPTTITTRAKRLQLGRAPEGAEGPGSAITCNDCGGLQLGRAPEGAEGGAGPAAPRPRDTWRFNWAAPRRARRGRACARGHQLAEGPASTGPRPGGRGGSRARLYSRPSRPRLQLGRAPEGAEGWPARSPRAAARTRFNWAAPGRARRGELVPRLERGRDRASTGPRPGGRGGVPTTARCAGLSTALQLGRAPEGAEGWEALGHGAPPCRASTGPRPGGRGGQPRHTDPHHLGVASTGPRPGGRGGHPRTPCSSTSTAASTGPRPGGRGGASLSVAARITSPLQLGRAPEGAEGHGESFPLHVHDWALQLGRAPEGAEGIDVQLGLAVVLAASTGPRPGGRGGGARQRARARA